MDNRPFNNLSTVSAEARAEYDLLDAMPQGNAKAAALDDYFYRHNFQRVVFTQHGMVAHGPAMKLGD